MSGPIVKVGSNKPTVMVVPTTASVVAVGEESVTVTPSEDNPVIVSPIGGKPGPAGPEGPQGPPGQAEGAGYTHVQGTPSATWVITHNLGFHPNVTVVDSGDSEVEGAISYGGTNVLTVTFSAAFSGKAYLS